MIDKFHKNPHLPERREFYSSNEIMKFLIHDIIEKRRQKLVDECVNEVISQPGDSQEKRAWVKVWRK